MKRSQVADLHQALTFIGLQIAGVERDNRRFGASTREAVRRFQADHQLPVTGIVGEATARALNGVLADRGALDEEVTRVIRGDAPRELRPDLELPAVPITLRALNLLKPGAAGQPASLGDLLDTLPDEERLHDTERTAFAIRYGKNGPGASLWDDAQANGYAARIPALKRTLALSEIAHGHKPLVAALQERRDPGEPESVIYLARLSRLDWLELALTHGAPPNGRATPADFALQLESTVEQRFPTDVFQERLASGDIRIKDFPTRQVVKLFSDHKDFNLREERADDFLERIGAKTPTLSAALRKVQRVLPLAGDLRTCAALLNAGFDSAYSIARTGVGVLATSLAGELTVAQARELHAAARDKIAASLAIVARCSPRFNPHAIEAIPYYRPSAAFLDKYPNLRNLFGDLDYCTCSHCESVLGPAAYLTDLLHLLESSGRSAFIPGGNSIPTSLPFMALHTRRPDLANLLLTCENTNTELPYIDLVLEVLENQVALPDYFRVTTQDSEEIPAALDRGELPDPIRNALAKTAVTIGAKPEVTRIGLSQLPLEIFRTAIPGMPEAPFQCLVPTSSFVPLKVADGAREWIVMFVPKGLWRAAAAEAHKLVKDLGDTTVDEFESSLSRGELPAGMLESGTNGWVPCSTQVKHLGASKESDDKPRFTAYEVSISLGLDLMTFTVGHTLHVRYLRPDDGAEIRTKTVPKQHQKVVLAWLRGELPDRLNRHVLDLLEIPTHPWKITHPEPGRCALRYEVPNFTLAVSDALLGVLSLTYRSSSVQTDLEAVPENRSPAAYEVLRKTVFPWTLPFDLWTEEVRAYLTELGVPRHKLMEVAGLEAGSNSYAREVLGLTASDREPMEADPWRVWDLKQSGNSVKDLLGQAHSGSWTEVLRSVSVLLERSGLSFRELLDVRQTGCGTVSWSHIAPKGECHPAKMTWADIDETQLAWIHAFTRLWRKSGWSMRDLSCGLAAVGQHPKDVLDSPQRMSLIGRLHSRLNQPILYVAAMLGHIEIKSWVDHTKEGEPSCASCYDSVFQRSALRLSEGFTQFAVNVESGELAYLEPGPSTPEPERKPLTDKSHFLAASLGITPDHVKQLVLGLNLPDELAVGNLTTLLGAVAFCRGLRLSIEDFVRWTAFLGNPFDAVEVEQRAKALLAFAGDVEFARGVNASLDELDYILRHDLEGEFADADTRMLDALCDIRSALQNGPVLGDLSTGNLVTQLRKLGAGESLLAAISGEAALPSVLRAEVPIEVEPELSSELLGKFYLRKSDTDSKVWLGCRGVVEDHDFVQLSATLQPEGAPITDALATRYRFIRQVLPSQLLYLVKKNGASAAPAFPCMEIALASDSVQSLPEDLRSVFSLQREDSRRTLRLTGVLTQAQCDTLATLLPDLKPDEIEALKKQSDDVMKTGIRFLDEAGADDLTVRTGAAIQDALLKLVPFLEADLLVSQVSTKLSLESETVRRLLDMVQLPSAPERAARDFLTDPILLALDSSEKIDTARYPEPVQVLFRLDKAARILRRNRMTVQQLDWLDGDSFAVLSFNDLPVCAGSAGLFHRWRALIQLMRFRDTVAGGPAGVQAISDLLVKTAAPPPDAEWSVERAASIFENGYGLEQTTIEKACRLLNVRTRDHFRSPERLLQLIGLLHLLQLLGTTVEVIESLVSEAPDCAAAMAARKLFMAQFDPETLPKRLQPISDKLRIRQRDALVSYLRWRDRLPDDNALLDYYLIDVKMGPCMRTSRIKQAISSVQMFIQRCMLNLEKDAPMKVLPSDIDATQWRWMKNYRVWEANRKIFLYPENWIEPDLRDDKTEVFRALESDLMQENLDYDACLEAFRGYLQRGAETARLTVVAMWQEPPGERQQSGRQKTSGKVIQILARDDGAPYHYYYRQLTMRGPTPAWTPWESIDGSMDSEHVFIFRLAGFIHIAYLEIVPDTSGTDWKVELVVRRKTSKGWSAGSRSRQKFSVPMVPNADAGRSFVFVVNPRDSGEAVSIACHTLERPPEIVASAAAGEPAVVSARGTLALAIHDIIDFEKLKERWNAGKFAARKNDTNDANLTADEWFFYRALMPDTREALTNNSDKLTGLILRDLNSIIRNADLWKEGSLKNLLGDETLRFGTYSFSSETNLMFINRLVLRDVYPGIIGFDMAQSLGGGVRALARFTDACGITFYKRITDAKITATILGSVADHPYSGIKTRDDGILEFEDCEISKQFSVTCVFLNETADKGQVDQLVLSATAYGSTKAAVFTNIEPSMKRGYLRHDLVFDLADPGIQQGKPYAKKQGNGKLAFFCKGHYLIGEDLSINWYAPSEPSSVSPPDGYDLVGSRLLCSKHDEAADVGQEDAPACKGYLTSASGRHLLTRCQPIPWHEQSIVLPPVTAYRDREFCLYFLKEETQGGSGRPWVIPEGQSWIFTGLRQMKQQDDTSVSLESLPTERYQADDKLAGKVMIPLDETSGVLDLTKSVRTLSVSFESGRPAGVYDWEMFFHAPLLMATQLSAVQRFEDAQRWFHTIFDPTTDAVGPESVRYWRLPPFRRDGKSIETLLSELATGSSDVTGAIEEWKSNPFNPHSIARSRIRAYQWTVVIRYIENLIAWGDQLFRRETIESINEATQLYVLAARILGPRPASVPRCRAASGSYLELAHLQDSALDDFSNAIVALEDAGVGAAFGSEPPISNHRPDIPIGLYFCVPPNSGIEALWDKVEERLFNIRHCRNIEGIERPLPLFEPPIDPALLVKATAAGLDISAVLADLAAPLPLYRFNVMLQKAAEVCGELKSLGAALLAAQEKNDAEALSLLRSTHEIELLRLNAEIRKQQIEEAELHLDALKESRKTAEVRYQYFQQLLGRSEITLPQPGSALSLETVPLSLAKSGLDSEAAGLGISQTESAQLSLLRSGQQTALASGVASTTAGVLLAIGGALSAMPRGSSPGPMLGDMGGPLTGAGHAANAIAGFLNTLSGLATSQAGMKGIIAGYERRRVDWIFQSNMALRELQQVDQQIAAAEIRIAVARQELDNLATQTENAVEVDEFMRSKFTNRELYRWMSTQLSSLYFNTYRLAHELAKRAERCFQFELGDESTSYVKFGHWDSLRKGLLAGDQLHQDLKRLEIAYLDRNQREYEITKHVSLLQLDPEALIALRETHACEFTIPEWLYDMDCPGHFLRRIKSVSLSVPCVTGPYTGVHCTLTLLSGVVRKSNGHESYGEPSPEDTQRFRFDYSRIQSVVTSSGQSDSGMFEPNLRDERYLPFEGAGAISTWRLELPAALPQFNYATISDVILHVRYTAREGGASLRSAAAARVSNLNGFALTRLFSLRHEFPTEWAAFKTAQPVINKRAAELRIDLKPEHYPYWAHRVLERQEGDPDVVLYAKPSEGSAVAPIQIFDRAVLGSDENGERPSPIATLQRDPTLPGLLSCPLKQPIMGKRSLFLAGNSIDELWMLVSLRGNREIG
jgi:hypothetical protein